MTFVLPHEHKPVRLPVVPATLTALLDGMVDGTSPIEDGTSKRAFLCRDPVYPLWIERTLSRCAGYLSAVGSATSWSLPARANTVIMTPVWDSVYGATSGGATSDGTAFSASMQCDNVVLAAANGTTAIFIPPNALFILRIHTGTVGGGSGIEFEIVNRIGGEEFVATMTATSAADGFYFAGYSGTTVTATGVMGEGIIPVGFTYLRMVRTTATGPTAAAVPTLQMGWATGGSFAAPDGTANIWVPYAMPPEFNNSTLPYGRTRLNSSAALFTNVTAALSKEGTVLASRLKTSVVDPWLFNAGQINSTHPSLRYFGPLEKGLYTFTTPTGANDAFTDNWMTMPSNSDFNATARPLFNYKDIGVYNAMVFSDLGSAGAGTQLAISAYTHIEFETTSSLFTPGVSTLPLEVLHAAEVALLRFGHFHENPTHWAAIASAARSALALVAPMVAPYIKQYGNHLVNKGVALLQGRNNGDRSMKQASLSTPKPKRAPQQHKKKTVHVQRRKK